MSARTQVMNKIFHMMDSSIKKQDDRWKIALVLKSRSKIKRRRQAALCLQSKKGEISYDVNGAIKESKGDLDRKERKRGKEHWMSETKEGLLAFR